MNFTNRYCLSSGNLDNLKICRLMGTQLHASFAYFILVALSHQMTFDQCLQALTYYFFTVIDDDPRRPDPPAARRMRFNYINDVRRWLGGLGDSYNDFLANKTGGQLMMLSRVIGWSTLGAAGGFVRRTGLTWDQFDSSIRTNKGWMMGAWSQSSLISWFSTQEQAEQRNHGLRWTQFDSLIPVASP